MRVSRLQRRYFITHQCIKLRTKYQSGKNNKNKTKSRSFLKLERTFSLKCKKKQTSERCEDHNSVNTDFDSFDEE